MFESLLTYLSNSHPWMPDGNRILWTPSILWTYVISTALTTAAYYSIPATLTYIAWHSKDIAFRKIYLMFGSFILACGTSHLLSIILLWHPIYWTDALIHAITALLSIGTAFFLIQLMPLLKKTSQPDIEIAIYKNLIQKGNSELSRMKARFKNTIEFAPVGIINISTNSDVLDVNQKFCAFIGYSHDEILSMNLKDITCEKCYVQHAIKLAQCLSGEISEFEEKNHYQHKNGHAIWGHILVKLIRHEDSNMDYFIEIIQDISLQKTLKDTLKIQSMAVSQSPNPVMITNLNREIKYVNEAFLKHSGYIFSEVLDQNPRMFYSEKTPPEAYTEMWSTLELGMPWKGELINKSKHGIESVELTEIIPIANENGIIDHYLALKEDITARKATELALVTTTDAAESLFESKSLFIANMSHEIRTPISAIIGFTDLALIKEMPDDIRDYLCKINNASLGLLNILNDILDFSKLEADKISINPDLFNLTRLKDNLYDFFKGSADKKGLMLSIDISPETPLNLICDELRLKQILINLLSNAIKFTDKGIVKLTISLVNSDASQAKLFFCVQDSGIGISKDDQTQLFQVFNQLDNTITRRFGGTGLGLSLSKNLLQLMGGEFTVTSTLGVGSRFCFNLMMDLPDSSIIHPMKHVETLSAIISDTHSDLTGTCILVVEDNDFNQQIIKEILSLSGIIVVLAGNGKEALALLEQQDFDAILMDVHMPVMDGFEATLCIRSQPRFAKLPIIALTAGVSQDERSRCLEVGMDDFLNKPINGRLLISTLKQHIKPKNKTEPQPSDLALKNQESLLQSNIERRLDVRVLQKDIGEDPIKLTKFLNFFQMTAQEISTEIITAIRAEQIDVVIAAAHKLSSSALTIGALDLGALCKAIEGAGKARDLAMLNTLQVRFEEEWTEVNKLLEAWPN